MTPSLPSRHSPTVPTLITKMYSGAQISLYPMTDDFVPLILDSLGAIDPYRPHLRIETDDLSTLLIGPPGQLFGAMRDFFVAASKTGKHVVLHATVSRGCPGGSDTEYYAPSSSTGLATTSREERLKQSLDAVRSTALTGQDVTAQFAYYPMRSGEKGNGTGEGDEDENGGYMREIYECIDFIQASGVLDRPKNFVTKLKGDAGRVFGTLERAFVGFAGEGQHVTLDVTVSANSPSART